MNIQELTEQVLRLRLEKIELANSYSEDAYEAKESSDTEVFYELLEESVMLYNECKLLHRVEHVLKTVADLQSIE